MTSISNSSLALPAAAATAIWSPVLMSTTAPSAATGTVIASSQLAQPVTSYVPAAGQDPQIAQLLQTLALLVQALNARRADMQHAAGAFTVGTATTGNVSVTGGSAIDQRNVNAALTKLANMTSGAPTAQALQQAGAHIVVDPDSLFVSRGYSGMQSYFNETEGVIHLRSSVVEDTDSTQLIYEIAHEGTHLLDAASSAKAGFMQRGAAAVANLGDMSTAAGAAAQQQLLLDDSLITENNAHFVGAQVMNEMGIDRNRMKQGTPGWVAQESGDPATVRRDIWNATLLDPTYNPDGLTPTYKTYNS